MIVSQGLRDLRTESIRSKHLRHWQVERIAAGVAAQPRLMHNGYPCGSADPTAFAVGVLADYLDEPWVSRLCAARVGRHPEYSEYPAVLTPPSVAMMRL